ncbi:hypothetical protein KL864_24550 [Mycolicibacterium goodii]|uniref:hypothetical protein n=1 Tax=Mycolicibacterium goodii TaxID=134601 RepID=UPI001BDC1A06|nr:hypothetical protein [Mycolicibacterium goodii]MBU8819068.1 hypothetical protein [Mycolicibacterium goodii]
MTEELGHIQDDDLGDVMTLGPMYKTDDAVAFLRDKVGIPDIFAATLTKARKRGELVASVFGQSVVFAERDLLAWVASRYGRSEECRAAYAEAARGNRNAAKRSR